MSSTLPSRRTRRSRSPSRRSPGLVEVEVASMSKSKSKPRPPRRPLCGREAAGLLDRCAGGSPGLLNPGRLSGLLDRCAGGRLSPVDRCARTFAAAALADGSRREARWAQLGPSQQRVFFDWRVCVRVYLRTAQSSRICNALRNAHARTCARTIRLCLAVCVQRASSVYVHGSGVTQKTYVQHVWGRRESCAHRWLATGSSPCNSRTVPCLLVEAREALALRARRRARATWIKHRRTLKGDTRACKINQPHEKCVGTIIDVANRKQRKSKTERESEREREGKADAHRTHDAWRSRERWRQAQAA